MSRVLRGQRWFLPRVIVAAALVAGGGAALGRTAGLFKSAPPAEAATHRAVERNAAERHVEYLASTEVYSAYAARQLNVGRNETFASLLIRAGATQIEASEALASIGDLYDPRRLEPGQLVNVFFDRRAPGQPRLVGLAFRSELGASITIDRTIAGVFIARKLRIPLTFEIARVNAMVGTSLYASALELGATDREVTALADACGYDLDFQRDVRPTDRFEIVFERVFDEDGHTVGTGKTLFVAIDTRRGTRLFFAFQAPGEALPSWYDAFGQSARRFLMMTPINGARVSSAFGMRTDPILGYSSLHRGVDFAAPSGTPILAAGDGVIARAGWNGEYGNYVRVRHGDGYETAYAHLSGFASDVHPGAPVLQGQIIGYVGTTGRSTGPHLHYEVLYGGSQIDPMSLHLASGRYLTNQDLELFRAEVERIDTLRANLWRGLTRVPVVNLAGITPNAPIGASSVSSLPQ